MEEHTGSERRDRHHHPEFAEHHEFAAAHHGHGGQEFGRQEFSRPRARARRGFGPVPGFGPMPGFGPGPGFPGGRNWPQGRGRLRGRGRRGDIRAAALALLAEEPMNGYQIIQQISERSGGLWQPSPGSVYPALAQLEDENLIASRPAESGRRGYQLTDEGRAYVAAHADELRAPWAAVTHGDASAAADMHALVGQVHLAAFQVISAGTQAQVDQARTVLTQARRALYRILADDDAPQPGQAGAPGPAADEAARPDAEAD